MGSFKKNSGITLMTLIITIIIMLILATVSVNVITEDDSVIQEAKEAKEATERADIEEQIAISILQAEAQTDKTTIDDVTQQLLNNKIITDASQVNTSTGAITVGDYVIEGLLDDYISGEGSGSEENLNWDELVADLEANPSTYLSKAQALGQTSTAAVGIGTDGEVVNLDMWQYYETDDGEGLSLGDNIMSSANEDFGYKPEYIQNGKIIGTVPQYIYLFTDVNYYGNYEESAAYPVTKMDGTFYYDSENSQKLLEAPEIPSTVVALRNTFRNSSKLTKVAITEGVTSIGACTFNGCESLSSITIENGVTSIGTSAFSGCTSLSNINIPDSVTNIEGVAFSGCTSLSSIEIPESVTSIGYNAFSRCTSLSSINIPESVTTIGFCAFSGWTASQTINCEILETDKPSGWDAKWDYYDSNTARKATLNWGVSM